MGVQYEKPESLKYRLRITPIYADQKGYKHGAPMELTENEISKSIVDATLEAHCERSGPGLLCPLINPSHPRDPRLKICAICLRDLPQ